MKAAIYILLSIYAFMYMWVFVCLHAHVRVLWNGCHTYFYAVFCAWESESNHHDVATHTSPITAWVLSSPLLASDLHVSWSVARPASPGPLLHIPPFSQRRNKNHRADADHPVSPHAYVWRQNPPACLWLSRWHSVRCVPLCRDHWCGCETTTSFL